MESKHSSDQNQQNTPRPDSEEYDLENPQNLSKPTFNSATEKRDSTDLPGVENMNDQQGNIDADGAHQTDLPDPDLGNDRSDDEDEDEKIIRT